ncbi:HPP family protein [Streptomyces sp. NPDC056480]|uniref:CBS domain-containing protein n=1 Tax=Streptomyces sp. NPDC056480 TaxID=3345833 RepID=UPI0036B41A7A
MAASPHAVSDVMSSTAIAIGPGASCAQIAEVMRDWELDVIPVVEGEGRVIGVVTAADLARDSRREALIPPRQARHELVGGEEPLAKDLMSAPAHTVRPHSPITQSARLMIQDQVSSLPVIDAIGMLEGLVHRTDIPREYFRSDAELASIVRESVLSRTPTPAEWDVTVMDGIVTLHHPPQEDDSLLSQIAWGIRAVKGVADVTAGA